MKLGIKSGKLKIKTDSPKGLRAVECGCCSTCVFESTERNVFELTLEEYQKFNEDGNLWQFNFNFYNFTEQLVFGYRETTTDTAQINTSVFIGKGRIEEGWRFEREYPSHLFGLRFQKDVYGSGSKYTVPAPELGGVPWTFDYPPTYVRLLFAYDFCVINKRYYVKFLAGAYVYYYMAFNSELLFSSKSATVSANVNGNALAINPASNHQVSSLSATLIS